MVDDDEHQEWRRKEPDERVFGPMECRGKQKGREGQG